MVLKATLTFVKRKEQLIVPTALAELDQDDVDFLGRHVAELRKAADAQDALLSKFQHGSGIPVLIKDLLAADDADFIKASVSFAPEPANETETHPERV